MSKKWCLKSEDDPQIVFSAEDAISVHSPHNDPLLVELGIRRCNVTKVLIDTGSSVDLIFQETLDKMGIDLCDMKPSTRSLTGFNGSSKIMLGTIRLPVYACGVVRTVKFSVISAKAHYNVILGTPWIHSMKAVALTYHQCVKFPGSEGKIQTLRGDQQAARDLLIATVKLQQATAHINAVAKPIERIYPQKEEIVEVHIDRSDPSKIVRVGTHLTPELPGDIVDFLKELLDFRMDNRGYERNQPRHHIARAERRSNLQTDPPKKVEARPRTIKGSERRSGTITHHQIDNRSKVPGVAFQPGRGEEKEWEMACMRRLHRSEQGMSKGQLSASPYRPVGRIDSRKRVTNLYGRVFRLQPDLDAPR
ncbi:hypothetical protein N665_1031s0002 [Sinapis alba]|nr:hypothetical protein N665_1031s0002 [Sinapis alba]